MKVLITYTKSGKTYSLIGEAGEALGLLTAKQATNLCLYEEVPVDIDEKSRRLYSPAI